MDTILVLSRCDELAATMSDREGLQARREQFDAGIVAEHGQKWFDENRPALDADWTNSLQLFGFTS